MGTEERFPKTSLIEQGRAQMELKALPTIVCFSALIPTKFLPGLCGRKSLVVLSPGTLAEPSWVLGA